MTTAQHKMIMVKFAEWLRVQKLSFVQDIDGPIWSSSYQGGGSYTSEELVSLFYQHLDVPDKK